MQQNAISILLVSPSGKQQPATVTVEEWNKQERLRRGLKFFGICWGAAVVAVFIPILHFILVPLLVLAGPIIGYYFYQQERMSLGGQGMCPNCGALLKIEKGPAKWPSEEMCTACHTMLAVTRTTPV